MNVRGQYLAFAVINDDTAVHLGKFGKSLGSERGVVKDEATCGHCINQRAAADHNECARPLAHDYLGCGSQRSAWGETSKKLNR